MTNTSCTGENPNEEEKFRIRECRGKVLVEQYVTWCGWNGYVREKLLCKHSRNDRIIKKYERSMCEEHVKYKGIKTRKIPAITGVSCVWVLSSKILKVLSEERARFKDIVARSGILVEDGLKGGHGDQGSICSGRRSMTSSGHFSCSRCRTWDGSTIPIGGLRVKQDVALLMENVGLREDVNSTAHSNRTIDHLHGRRGSSQAR